MGDSDDVEAAIVHLGRWASDAKTEAAADSRLRRQWTQQQAEDEATLLSVLVDMAERRAAVAVHTRAGATIRGAVAGVGRDYLAVVRGPQLTFVVTAAIDWIRPDGDAAPAAFGDRAAPPSSLMGVLTNLVGEGHEVRVVSGEEIIAGELLAAGADVLTLRPAGASSPGQVVYVPAASVSELSLRLSG
ncbi:MAG TPA: hypothetical protein VFB78_05810 [Acidimicrobiales bacterium]|nr:hypothetical protein [Acidimicrobiales bacterium]